MLSGNFARGVPLFGRDCRVALRAPRNDKRGVRAPRNKSNDTLSILSVGILHCVQNDRTFCAMSPDRH
ncbi:MAG: hypothetical protein LBL66_03225 [Clostridiales bacterium]|nr:hypothetical protein [Clostridiales bacterium]